MAGKDFLEARGMTKVFEDTLENIYGKNKNKNNVYLYGNNNKNPLYKTDGLINIYK